MSKNQPENGVEKESKDNQDIDETPDTLNLIELKKKEDIYNPELNTLLGTTYLGGLSKRFKSELIYTAGSYNAGPHNMIKWIKRWKGEPIDVFVEQIPFNETKNYVKRVYRSYKLYKQIYSS